MFDLLVDFKKIVTKFSRYHKYTHGQTLRYITLDILMLIVLAYTLEKLKKLVFIQILQGMYAMEIHSQTEKLLKDSHLYSSAKIRLQLNSY